MFPLWEEAKLGSLTSNVSEVWLQNLLVNFEHGLHGPNWNNSFSHMFLLCWMFSQWVGKAFLFFPKFPLKVGISAPYQFSWNCPLTRWMRMRPLFEFQWYYLDFLFIQSGCNSWICILSSLQFGWLAAGSGVTLESVSTSMTWTFTFLLDVISPLGMSSLNVWKTLNWLTARWLQMSWLECKEPDVCIGWPTPTVRTRQPKNCDFPVALREKRWVRPATKWSHSFAVSDFQFFVWPFERDIRERTWTI